MAGGGGARRSARKRARHERAAARFERDHGPRAAPLAAGRAGGLPLRRFEQVKEELQARELAEYRRLLYVALTRARDMLILSGSARA